MPRMILTDPDTLQPRAIDFDRDTDFETHETVGGQTSLTVLHRNRATTYRVVETVTQIQLLRNVALR